jgi:hypothetical protein
MLLALTFNLKGCDDFPWSEELYTEDVDLATRFGICMDALVVLPSHAFDMVWFGYEHILSSRLDEVEELAKILADAGGGKFSDNAQMQVIIPMLLSTLIPAFIERRKNDDTQIH